MNRRSLLLGAAALLTSPAQAKPAQGLFIADSPKVLPALDIRDENSRAAGLDTLSGRPVLLNLWASWCGPCVAELPMLDRLKPRLEDKGIALVALSLDRSGKIAVANTFARIGITALGIRTDESRAAAEKLDAAVLPVTLLLDREGREVARYVGAADWGSPPAQALLEALATGRKPTPEMAPPQLRFTSAP